MNINERNDVYGGIQTSDASIQTSGVNRSALQATSFLVVKILVKRSVILAHLKG